MTKFTSLLDDSSLSERIKYENGWKPGAKFDPESGVPSLITTDAVFEDMGYDAAVADLNISLPAGYALRLIDVTYHHSKTKLAWARDAQGEDAVTRPNENRRVQWKFKVIFIGDLTDVIDLDSLTKQLLKAPKVKNGSKRATNVKRAGAYITSDEQLQKVDRLGGTPELIKRIKFAQGELLSYLQKQNTVYDEFALINGGDIFEGFQNLVKQKVNNDIGTSTALGAVIDIIVSNARIIAPFTKEVVLAVPPSNHCQPGRQSGEAYEQPGEDLGVFCFTAAAKILRAMGIKVRLETAHYIRNTVLFTLADTPIALRHGHIGLADRVKAIEKEIADSRGMENVVLVLEGHRHNERYCTAHRTNDGRQRFLVQLGAMENGSEYYNDAMGSTSITTGGQIMEFETGKAFHPLHSTPILYPPELLVEKSSDWWTRNVDGLKELY
jgi:hypothetical protein